MVDGNGDEERPYPPCKTGVGAFFYCPEDDLFCGSRTTAYDP